MKERLENLKQFYTPEDHFEYELLLSKNAKKQKELTEIDKLKSKIKDLRNALCLKCGKYAEEHLGACDGCKWRDYES